MDVGGHLSILGPGTVLVKTAAAAMTVIEALLIKIDDRQLRV
jgi:hypothetical protein